MTSPLDANNSDRLGILLVSTADWDNPYWTNKQHMAVQFALRGHRVLYIESQGLRAPTVTGKDLRRIFNRLKKGLRPPQQARPGLWVWAPLVFPFHGKKWIRKLNRALLRTGVRLWSWRYSINADIIWTYSPLTTELYETEAYKLLVYHAVDDIKTQPGMPTDAIEIAERDLSQKADLIFTTSRSLQEHHITINPETHYFSNVADFNHFNSALAAETTVPSDIAAIPSPRIGFVGAISSYKLNFTMIRDLAVQHPMWSFVFVGEIGEGDPLTDASTMVSIPNLHFLGGRPYSILPSYLKAMDVAILPNILNEYTRSMFPMKFFEYLAAGRPVVATRLHALREMIHVATFADNTKDFGAAIAEAIDGHYPPLELRLKVARTHTYEARTDKMMDLIYSHLSANPPMD
jgi:glycosyltransferase involved in cell wall biosynthesis